MAFDFKFLDAVFFKGVIYFVATVGMACNLMAQPPFYSDDFHTIIFDQDPVSWHVKGMAQDSIGFLWIANPTSIKRFDGVNFKEFTTLKWNSSLIPLKEIREMAEGPDGNFWILEQSRLLVFNPYSFTLERIFQTEGINSGIFINEEAVYFSAASYGAEKKGILYSYHFDNDSLLRLNFPYPIDHTTSMDENVKMVSIIGSSEINFKEDQKRGFTSLHHLISQGNEFGINLGNILSDESGNLYVCSFSNETGSFLYKYGSNELHLIAEAPSESRFRGISRLQPNDFFWFFDEGKKKLILYHLLTQEIHYEIETTLENFNAFLEYKDHSGTFWLGNNFGIFPGIVAFYPYQFSFNKVQSERFKPLNNVGNHIRAMTVGEKGEIYFGASMGIGAYFPNNDSIVSYSFENKTSNVLPDLSIWDLIYEDEGLWFSSSLYNLLFADLEKVEIREYDSGITRLRNLFPIENSFIFSYENKIGKISKSDFQINFFNYDSDLFFGNGVRWRMTSDSILWLCSNTGLYGFSDKMELVDYYNENTQPQLINPNVTDLAEDEEGRLWIATFAGLVVIDRERAQIDFQIDASDGLCNNLVACMEMDTLGHLWVGTYQGLSRVNTSTMEIFNFYTSDGLPHNEFNRASSLQNDGNIYFGTQNGLVYFNPYDFKGLDIKILPNFVISTLSVFDQSGDEVHTQYPNIDKISIPAGNRFFKLDFALLDYKNPFEVKYQVYLEGWNRDWSERFSSGEVQYNNLAAGDYELIIRAFDSNGVLAGEQTIPIEVKDFFYNSFFFRAFVALILIALIVYISRFHLRQELKFERLRTRIASDLHDEVGSVMTRIGLSAEILKINSLSDSERLTQVNEIADQSREATSTMRDVIWTIDARQGFRSQLLDKMRQHLREMCELSNFNYSFEVSDLKGDHKVNMSAKQAIYFIFKEAVNNAIKHSGGDLIVVKIEKIKEKFHMTVRDNGTGFIHRENQGMGLQNIRMRAQQINGKIEIQGDDGCCIRLIFNNW